MLFLSAVTPGRLWLWDLYTSSFEVALKHSCGRLTVRGPHYLFFLGRAVLSGVWALETGALESSVCLNIGWGPFLTPSEEI